MSNQDKAVDARVEHALSSAGRHTTVFADGSMWDPKEGYTSNGAPIRGKDDPAPKVIRRGAFLPEGAIGAIVLILAGLSFLSAIGFGIAQEVKRYVAMDTISEELNSSGFVEVSKFTDNGEVVVLKDTATNEHFQCDVAYVTEDDGDKIGLIFCSPGAPETFTISL